MHKHVRHPCIDDKLAELRDRRTPHPRFRTLTHQITQLLCFEALAGLPTTGVSVDTPLAPAECRALSAEVVIVPILRAGLSMLDAVLSVVPSARVGFAGVYRDDQTKQPVDYYWNVPTVPASGVYVVVDPMLATGGSTIDTLDRLKGQGAEHLIVLCLVTCPEGLAAVAAAHPDVTVFTAAIDSHLDERKYIVPGLGDAGDRLYGND